MKKLFLLLMCFALVLSPFCLNKKNCYAQESSESATFEEKSSGSENFWTFDNFHNAVGACWNSTADGFVKLWGFSKVKYLGFKSWANSTYFSTKNWSLNKWADFVRLFKSENNNTETSANL